MNSTDQLYPPPPRRPIGDVDLILDLSPESRTWIDSLNAEGPEHERAVDALHSLLLKAARFEVNRRRAIVSCWHDEDADDLARQAAGDALITILSKLSEFRGRSRFTTWACKFVLRDTAAKVRRHDA